MVRTIVSLTESDKRWLDRYSAERHQSASETVRLAIREFQRRVAHGTTMRVLRETAGLLKGGPDSVDFVRRLRKEWD